MAGLRKLFETEAELASVAVARKRVRIFPELPCFVIALRVKMPWWKPRSSGASQKLVSRLVERIQLPGHFLVFVDEGNLKSLAKKVFAVPGAVAYEQAQKA